MAVKDKIKNLSFVIDVNQLTNFLKKIKDLTLINPRIVMRIENDNILIFSFVGETFKDIHAFKNYIFKTKEIFSFKHKIEDPIFFIAKDGKKFLKILSNLLEYQNEINGKISINDENYVNFITFDNKKLDIKIIGSDPILIGSQISIDDINFLMDTDKSLFKFRLNIDDFQRIKKMSLIDNEPKSVLYLNINNKNIFLGETKWKLNIDKIEYDDVTLSFPKSYFNTINPNQYIDIYIFDEFIVCKYDDYNLMILMETSI